jgi:hypothetical protein
MKATHPRDCEDPYPTGVSVAWRECPATLHLHQPQAPSAQMVGNDGGDVKKGAMYGR